MVLAVGALGFGVFAQLRLTDVEERLDAVERQVHVLEGVVADANRDAPVTEVSTTAVPDEPSTTAAAGRPDDVGEARAGIVRAFEVVYRGGTPIEERLRLIDDPTGVGEALTAASRSPAAVVVDTATARVDDVRFTSAAAATVTYTVTAQGAEALTDRLGTSLAVDGTWKVTRATVCRDLAELGFPCG